MLLSIGEKCKLFSNEVFVTRKYQKEHDHKMDVESKQLTCKLINSKLHCRGHHVQIYEYISMANQSWLLVSICSILIYVTVIEIASFQGNLEAGDHETLVNDEKFDDVDSEKQNTAATDR